MKRRTPAAAAIALAVGLAPGLTGCGGDEGSATPTGLNRAESWVLRASTQQQIALALAADADLRARKVPVRALALRVRARREAWLRELQAVRSRLPAGTPVGLAPSPDQAGEAIPPTALRGARSPDELFISLLRQLDGGFLAVAAAATGKGEDVIIDRLATRLQGEVGQELSELERVRRRAG